MKDRSGPQGEPYLPLLKPLGIALAAIAALALGVWTATKWYAPATVSLQSGILLETPRPIADFVLTDQDGQAFTKDRLLGRWSLVFAGFTHCPDVCPTTLQLFKLLEQKLRQGKRSLNTIFLSVDSKRDTPELLQRYVRYFSPQLTGITGTAEQIDRICASLGLAYIIVPGKNDSDYTIDHSSALVLINPRGEIAGYFQAPHKLDTLTTDLSRLLPISE